MTFQVYKPAISAGMEAIVNRFKRYNSACRHFQKPSDRIVHLSNLYSATKIELAYDGVLCSACTQLAISSFCAAIY